MENKNNFLKITLRNKLSKFSSSSTTCSNHRRSRI